MYKHHDCHSRTFAVYYKLAFSIQSAWSLICAVLSLPMGRIAAERAKLQHARSLSPRPPRRSGMLRIVR